MNKSPNDLFVRNEQSMKVSSLTLDKDELHSFCRLLQERARAAGKIEVSNYQKGELTDEQYQLNIQTLQEWFEIRVTVSGKNGENLWGAVEEVFSSPNFPDEVKSMFVDSGSPLKATQQ